jgi:hypothetical protein
LLKSRIDTQASKHCPLHNYQIKENLCYANAICTVAMISATATMARERNSHFFLFLYMA